MADKMTAANRSELEKGLVSMFLRLSPEERLKANDNAVRGILELRNAYQMLVELNAHDNESVTREDENFVL
ncbi:MAG: hypothetical protein LJE96_07285 [Deltaproteobacteria bacterium]|nr:hypothetical protein [Deltaproteobacteria bacterium]